MAGVMGPVGGVTGCDGVPPGSAGGFEGESGTPGGTRPGAVVGGTDGGWIGSASGRWPGASTGPFGFCGRCRGSSGRGSRLPGASTGLPGREGSPGRFNSGRSGGRFAGAFGVTAGATGFSGCSSGGVRFGSVGAGVAGRSRSGGELGGVFLSAGDGVVGRSPEARVASDAARASVPAASSASRVMPHRRRGRLGQRRTSDGSWITGTSGREGRGSYRARQQLRRRTPRREWNPWRSPTSLADRGLSDRGRRV